MNQKVRKFLIDQCVLGQPIYYEAIGQILGLDLGLDSHRQILSKTLIEISAFEHDHGRPLIRSIFPTILAPNMPIDGVHNWN